MKIDLNQPVRIDWEKLKQLGRNRSRVILGGAIIALVAALALYFVWHTAGDKSQTAAGITSAPPKTPSVLPETRRSETPGQSREALDSQFRDPFAGPMALKGIMRGGTGDMAIIEVGDTTFVAGTGSLVADTWTVSEIDSGSVTLKAGDQTIKLAFGGRSKASATATGAAREDQKPRESAAQSQKGGEVKESETSNAGNGQ